MADMKISQLPPADALDGSELLELVQVGASRRATADDLAALAGAGHHTIWLPATAWQPRLSGGPAVNKTETATSKIVLATLDFDAAGVEYAQTSVRMPHAWDLGALTAEVRWTAAGGAGAVVWALQLRRVGDGTSLDGAFGTARSVTDSLISPLAEHRSAETAGMLPTGTPASGDRLLLQLYRDAAAGGDTLATDAKLLGVTLFYGTLAGTDD